MKNHTSTVDPELMTACERISEIKKNSILIFPEKREGGKKLIDQIDQFSTNCHFSFLLSEYFSDKPI